MVNYATIIDKNIFPPFSQKAPYWCFYYSMY